MQIGRCQKRSVIELIAENLSFIVTVQISVIVQFLWDDFNRVI